MVSYIKHNSEISIHVCNAINKNIPHRNNQCIYIVRSCLSTPLSQQRISVYLPSQPVHLETSLWTVRRACPLLAVPGSMNTLSEACDIHNPTPVDDISYRLIYSISLLFFLFYFQIILKFYDLLICFNLWLARTKMYKIKYFMHRYVFI